MDTAQRAVLFVDVTDSTKIYESLGDTVALALINGVFGRLDKIIARHGGSTFQMKRFSTANAAFDVAVMRPVSVPASRWEK